MTSSQRTASYFAALKHAALKIYRGATNRDILHVFHKRSTETPRVQPSSTIKPFQLVNPHKFRFYDQCKHDEMKHEPTEIKHEHDHDRGHITATVPDIEPSKLVQDTVITVCTDRKTLCRSCNGCGVVPHGGTFTCIRCDGRGTMYVSDPAYNSSNKMSFRHNGFEFVTEPDRTCLNCDGDGTVTVPPRFACPMCRGRGYNTDKYTCDLTVNAGTPNGYQYTIDHAGDEYAPGRRGHIRVRINHTKTDTPEHHLDH